MAVAGRRMEDSNELFGALTMKVTEPANPQALFGHAEVATLGPEGRLQPELKRWVGLYVSE